MVKSPTRSPGGNYGLRGSAHGRVCSVRDIPSPNWCGTGLYAGCPAGAASPDWMFSCGLTWTKQAFGWAVRQSAEVENNMNSVERLLHYAKSIEQEPPYTLPSNKPPPSWPSKGAIRLDNVTASYRAGLPVILKDVSVDIRGGEHVALIGRTGAGKSTGEAS